MNGYTKNYYDNGTLQSEGTMKNGLPDGIWKYYDPFGKLNHVGEYVLGKRNGRWLSGDLSKTKYLGDICMNPNLPDLEEQMKYQEKLIDIYIRYFNMGTLLNSESYDVNLNDFDTEKKDTENSEIDSEEEIEEGE
jgi:antitoxin component YwqK of YwqJK toxin-antitoxin module